MLHAAVAELPSRISANFPGGVPAGISTVFGSTEIQNSGGAIVRKIRRTNTILRMGVGREAGVPGHET
jgi:hypothetical protein